MTYPCVSFCIHLNFFTVRQLHLVLDPSHSSFIATDHPGGWALLLENIVTAFYPECFDCIKVFQAECLYIKQNYAHLKHLNDAIK